MIKINGQIVKFSNGDPVAYIESAEQSVLGRCSIGSMVLGTDKPNNTEEEIEQ